MKYDEPKLNLLIGHIGMFERSVPMQRWRVISILMLTLLVLAVGMWEWKMRSLGLRTDDIDDSNAHWTVEWRKVDSSSRDQVLLVGDSRSAADNNLDIWQRVSGIRPIQLSIGGANQTPILEYLATSTQFKGLVVLGSAENRFYADRNNPETQLSEGTARDYLKYAAMESPSQRVGHVIKLWLSRKLAFLDEQYRLLAVLGRLDLTERIGANKFFLGIIPKVQACADDRNCETWDVFNANAPLVAQARQLWTLLFPPTRIPDAQITAGIERQRQAIEQIRRRGGEVVLVRYPSAGDVLANEHAAMPRAQAWDRLLNETNSFGINFEDYPQMRDLDVREWSHLTGVDAKKFTHAYVTVLCQQLPLLKQHGATCKEG